MYGGCHALALQLHAMTGLPMLAFAEPDGESERVVHIALQLDNGQLLDIYGERSSEQVLQNCRDQHQCDTSQWTSFPTSPQHIKACIVDGILEPITRRLLADARSMATRLLAAHADCLLTADASLSPTPQPL